MAGTITHSWKGTVLTITSDAGTSSMDLAGATGCRGPQGRPGIIIDEKGRYVVSDLVTQEELDAIYAGYDNKTIIRDDNGNLTTSFGGALIERVYGENVYDNESPIYTGPTQVGTAAWLQFEIDSDAVEGQEYDIIVVVDNKHVTRFKKVLCQNGTAINKPPSNTDYFTDIQFLGPNMLFVICPNASVIEGHAITRISINTPSYAIYVPLDANVLPLDNDTLIINEEDQVCVGANVATKNYVSNALATTKSEMETWTKAQIDSSIVGGDEVLTDYYTKAQVDAMFARLTSSEEVDY